MRSRKRGRLTLSGDPAVQEYPYSPPPRPSKYQTRHSTAVISHFPKLLRSPVRSILKTSSPSARPKCENIEPLVSDGLPSCCGPTPSRADNVGMEVTSEAVDPQPSMDQCLFSSEDADMFISNGSPCCSGLIVSEPIQDTGHKGAEQIVYPQRETDVVPRVNDKPEKSNTNFSHRSSRCLSTASSFNITAFAQRLHEDMEEDPDEVESALDPASVCVEVYNVKIDFAPLIGDIFNRYGDIAVGSEVKTPVIRSLLLQHVCDIYKRLKEAKFCSIPLRKLEEMRDEVQDLENMKINVEWLRKKLDEIIQAHIDFGNYLTVKNDEKANVESLGRDEEELKAYEDQLSLIQQKISAKKEGIVEKKAKDDLLFFFEKGKKILLSLRVQEIPSQDYMERKGAESNTRSRTSKPISNI